MESGTMADGSAFPTRVTNKQILTIQYLRAFAAITVVSAHATTSMFLGQAGVDVFFVISGFIMWTITAGKQDIFHFVKNRVVRIVPLYWIATILMGLHQKAPPIAVIKSMLFIPFVGEADQIWPVLVQGWTLNYEMFFYALVAVSMLMSGTQRLVFLVGTIAFLAIIGMLVTFSSPIALTYTNPLLLEFCFGIILAELRFRVGLSSLRLAALFGALSVVLFWFAPSDHLPGLSRFASWGIPSALLVASGLLLEGTGRVRRIVTLLVLGEASYAIYLFHPFLLKTVMKAFSGSFPAIDTIAVVVSTSVFGVIVAYFVEKPLLRLIHGGIRVSRA